MPDFADADLMMRPHGAAEVHSGKRNALKGASAEDSVLRRYLENGARLLERRWSQASGEIDLILRDGAQYVFVEVKSSRTFESALARISPAQVRRIYRTAEAYLARTPEGSFAETRFDVALVDGYGAVDVMKGALLPY